MLEKIKEAAEKKVDGEKPQCFVLFILSHGGIDDDGDEGPLGTDGKHLKKKDIIAELDSCRNLIGVPRLVFLQCCRGGRRRIVFAVLSGVTRGGGGPPRVTPSSGVTPEGKKFMGKFTKNSRETRSDR